MDSLQGQIKDENKLIGYLSSTDSQLKGSLSGGDVLVGQLISQELTNLRGSLSATGVLMEGNLSIPPEIPTDTYEGDYTVVSKPFTTGSLPTQGLKMRHDVVVLEIPYYETGNEHGYTVYIGGE